MERVTLKMIPARKPRIFYGYWIVAVAFFGAFVFGGCSYYVFSLFVKPLQIEFGWGRGEIMIAMTILFLVIGVASPLIGRLVDRYGVRVVVSIGATIAGLGFVLISQMGSLWHFYFGYIVVGVGMAAAGTVPVTALISNWFERRRGMAVGITGMGIGTGGFALTPLFGGYIIPNFGWQMAYIALALITWLLVPVVLLVVRTRPSDKGLYPDGAKASETITETQAILAHSEGLTLKMALVTSGFWLIALSFFLNTLSQDGVIQNQVPHLQDIGFPLAMASGALGTVGLGSLIGKFSFGWVCDRIKPKYAFSIGISLQLEGIIILMNIKPT